MFTFLNSFLGIRLHFKWECLVHLCAAVLASKISIIFLSLKPKLSVIPNHGFQAYSFSFFDFRLLDQLTGQYQSTRNSKYDSTITS